MWEVVQQTKKAEHINTGVQFKKLFHMGKGDKEIYYCSITVISCEHKERLGLLLSPAFTSSYDQ